MKSEQNVLQSEQQPEGMLPERAYLKPERIQELLRELPGWQLGACGRAIERRWKFTSFAEAQAYVGFVGKAAIGHRQPVTIAVSGKRVDVALAGYPVKGCIGGLSNPVFKLAAVLG